MSLIEVAEDVLAICDWAGCNSGIGGGYVYDCPSYALPAPTGTEGKGCEYDWILADGAGRDASSAGRGTKNKSTWHVKPLVSASLHWANMQSVRLARIQAVISAHDRFTSSCSL